MAILKKIIGVTLLLFFFRIIDYLSLHFDTIFNVEKPKPADIYSIPTLMEFVRTILRLIILITVFYIGKAYLKYIMN